MELHVAAINRTTSGQACEAATDEAIWPTVLEAALGETQDEVATEIPVWWTERVMFSYLLLTLGITVLALSQSLPRSGRTAFLLFIAGSGIIGLSFLWNHYGVAALKFETVREIQVTSPAVQCGEADAVIDADDNAAVSDSQAAQEQPGTRPSLIPPVPPPATPPCATFQTAPASAQVEAVRSFLHGDADESSVVPEVAKKSEAVPAIFFGLGSTVTLTGYLENTHLNGLRGTVT